MSSSDSQEIKTNTPLTRKTPRSAGYELKCLGDLEIKPGDHKVVETGIRIIGMPKNYYAEIHGKSRYIKNSIIILGGIIDSDYTGTIKVGLYNGGCKTFRLKEKSSIAQLILKEYHTFDNEEIEELPIGFEHTGFGSTGD
jgi:deoxyuridine 5'-triphosphate nucleotidohydrolase